MTTDIITGLTPDEKKRLAEEVAPQDLPVALAAMENLSAAAALYSLWREGSLITAWSAQEDDLIFRRVA